jgi:hypothetical protein
LRKGGKRRRKPRRSVPGEVVESIRIDGDLGSHALEALQLEVRRLANACGLDIKEIRIETVATSGKRA